MADASAIGQRYAAIGRSLNERSRRLFAAAEARTAGSVVHGSGGGAEALGDVGDRPPQLRMPILPFKLNQNCRHHIPRQRRQVTNWPAYDASLRQRGSLTVWFTDEAIAAWLRDSHI